MKSKISYNLNKKIVGVAKLIRLKIDNFEIVGPSPTLSTIYPGVAQFD